jgi:hypothetical protein
MGGKISISVFDIRESCFKTGIFNFSKSVYVEQSPNYEGNTHEMYMVVLEIVPNFLCITALVQKYLHTPITFEYKNVFMYIFLINFLCLAVNVNCHLKSRNCKHAYWYLLLLTTLITVLLTFLMSTCLGSRTFLFLR